MMQRTLAGLLVALGVLAMTPVLADFDEDYEAKPWQEIEIQLPTFASGLELLPFYVSAISEHRFAVDANTLTVGSDGVVRYVLVVETAGGARNVTYEGIRCQTRERRIYASGRRDGAWSKSRLNEWVRIKDVPSNRYHAALFLDYFCPGGVIVRNAAEAVSALRQGGHPDNKRW